MHICSRFYKSEGAACSRSIVYELQEYMGAIELHSLFRRCEPVYSLGQLLAALYQVIICCITNTRQYFTLNTFSPQTPQQRTNVNAHRG